MLRNLHNSPKNSAQFAVKNKKKKNKKQQLIIPEVLGDELIDGFAFLLFTFPKLVSFKHSVLPRIEIIFKVLFEVSNLVKVFASSKSKRIINFEGFFPHTALVPHRNPFRTPANKGRIVEPNPTKFQQDFLQAQELTEV